MRIVVDLQACQSSGSRQRGIGRYSLALAQAMARQAGAHELWLTLNAGFAETLAPLRLAFADLLPVERIVTWRAPGPVAEYDANNAWRRRAGELLREQMLAELRPDMVHVTSLFEGHGDDTLTSIGALPEKLPSAVTLYDLIPLIHAPIYLAEAGARNWYYRKLGWLKNAELLLSISAATRQEALDWLGLPPERVVNISSAVDARFRQASCDPALLSEVRQRYGLKRPFAMYTGGIDHRKNIDALVRAFASLAGPLRSQYQLAIVCGVQAADAERLQKLAKRAGLAPDELVLTGYVPDADLPLLYNDCALFVFPSWHEGFGLPALEAMTCGAPVIAACTSSLPEVIGRADALFDPRDDAAIAAKLQQALSDAGFRDSLREHGRIQCKKFSWDASAKSALAAFEATHERLHRRLSVACEPLQRKPRLAYVSPLPPERSGIADYATQLLPELARYYDIDLVTCQTQVADPWLEANLKLRDLRWFAAHAQRYERILYHFGNSPLHAQMFTLLERDPGVVVLHDFFLSGVLAQQQFAGVLPGAWTTALYESHGYAALQDSQRADRAGEVIVRYPCNAAVLESADGVIVHASHSLDLARRWYGDSAAVAWETIPLLRKLPLAVERQAARDELGLSRDDFLVCSFGMLGPTKLNHRLLQAWLTSTLSADRRCRLVFVGVNDPGPYGQALSAAIEASGLAPSISITGFAEPERFRCYLAAADLAVQLRTQSRGESSGAVLDCMAHGIATIVNAHGAMAELPDDAVVKLGDEFDEFDEAELAEQLAQLRAEPALRHALGQRARARIARHHAPDQIAARYFAAIERYAQAEPKSRRRRSVEAIAALETQVTPGDHDLADLARCLASTYRGLGQRQVLLDLGSDPGLGLGRVGEMETAGQAQGARLAVRELLSTLLATPSAFRLEPVTLVREGRTQLHYARRASCELLELPALAGEDEPAEIRAGDLYIGPASVRAAEPELLAELEATGAKVYSGMDELLPLLQAGFFTAAQGRLLAAWLQSR